MIGFYFHRGDPRRTPPQPSPAILLLLLPILQLFDVVLLCCHLTGVEGFEPLIQIPHCRDDDGSGSKRVVSVDDFGAVGNGLHNDTLAFMQAWEMACSLPARTVLEVPARKKYLVGPIDFSGPCCSNLTLRISGTIVAPDDPGIWHKRNPHKWLYFHGMNHLTVRGGGTINGMGERWWAQSCKIKRTNPCRHAPTAITFHRCKKLKIQNLLLLNSQQMHIGFTHCAQVKASGLEVIAPAESPNTDGIHISASVSVEIKNSKIKTGDDCISIVSNSSKVRIRNIECGPGHGISIGSLGKSNSWSKVYDVRVNQAILSNTENGLRIKTWQGGQGFARKIAFQNVVMINVSNPIIIDQYYCDSFLPCPNQTSAVKVGEISYTGIRGTSATENAIVFACSDSFPCEKIFLRDIHLFLHSGGDATAYCWKASGSNYGLIHPPSCLSRDGNYSIERKVLSSTALWSIAK